MPKQRRRCRARNKNTGITLCDLVPGRVPVGFVVWPKPCDPLPPTATLQSSGDDDGTSPSPTSSETSDSVVDALLATMNVQGASFAAQARAAELNAAAAARARNGEMESRFNNQLPSYVGRAHHQPAFRTIGGHNMTPSKQMKLSAEAPHYTPKGMESGNLYNRAGVHISPRYATSGNTISKGAHPLRNVTNLDGLAGDWCGDGAMLHSYPLRPDPKDIPGGPRFMGPDDVSPTKQEEKLALRDRGYSQDAAYQTDVDPFVSTMPQFPVQHENDNYAYDMVAHPGLVGQGQMSGYGENFVYSQPSVYNGYADLHSHTKVGAREYENLPSMGTGPAQHPAARFANQSQDVVFETSHRHRRDTLMSSVVVNPSTPARGAANGGSERVNIESADSRNSRNPDHGQSPLDAVKLHSSNGSNNNNVSRDLDRTHDDHVAQHHPAGDTELHMQYPGSNLENPLYHSTYNQGIHIDPQSLSSNGNPYQVQTVSQTPAGFRYIDAYIHLNYWQRPVPWSVARAGTVFPRVSMTTPPPGLPVPPGKTADGDQVQTPEQLEKEEKKREAHARAESSEQTLRQLNDRIREMAFEERDRRIKAGEDKASAENSADITFLLGQVLVNLSSYMTGNSSDQPRGFAQFGPAPEHAIEPSNGGRRSLFDIDQPVDA